MERPRAKYVPVTAYIIATINNHSLLFPEGFPRLGNFTKHQEHYKVLTPRMPSMNVKCVSQQKPFTITTIKHFFFLEQHI